ncbi:MAG TPA: right-handed parallel beta-helix repeat-containing protein [Terriglobia bacterium]|nr:right-handed parallel beta-helix repeat-containing protein [Terriglobia bacterium]
MNSVSRRFNSRKSFSIAWVSASVLLLGVFSAFGPQPVYAKRQASVACHGQTKNCQATAPTASLSSQPASITPGQSSTLSWSSQNATSLDLEPGIGAVAAQGSVTVTPQQTTTYTLSATGSGGSSTATATITVTATQAAGTQLNPGDNIQAAVNNSPTGTTFILAPGVYRMQIVVPKAGDVFSGESGAILDGAQLIDASSWRQISASVWVAQASGITQQSSYRGVCSSADPACMYPEDLFFDSKPLRRVASSALVVPGAWYLDYGTEKIYVGSNPGGHVTEMSTLGAAFWGDAGSVTIQGLVIEKYACIAGKGAVNAMNSLYGYGAAAANWKVDSNEIMLNHGVGVRVNSGMVVTNNKIHDNGQMGIAGNGDQILIQNNEVYKNNYAGYAFDWEAGGIKFASYATNVTIGGNYVHDNAGPGIHADISCDYVTIKNNHTAHNIGSGIHYEISYNGIISGNTIENDGSSPQGTGFWYGGGILISNSSNVQVYGNTVTDCMNGIGGTQANRGTDAKTGAVYTLQNLSVHDNIITQKTGYAAGIVKASVFDDSVYTSWGNHFQNNTFYLSTPGYPYFYWLDQNWTYAQWQTYASEH